MNAKEITILATPSTPPPLHRKNATRNIMFWTVENQLTKSRPVLDYHKKHMFRPGQHKRLQLRQDQEYLDIEWYRYYR